MNKEEFMLVLQASLFAFDGMSPKEICCELGISEQISKAGYDLAQYLKAIRVSGNIYRQELKGGAKTRNVT